MEKTGTYSYHVESFHLDCTERLSLTVLGNQLLNAAARHAEALGYGRETLRQRGFAWVFSRLAITMDDYPREFDDYTIRTWVSDVSRFFSTRCFAVFDAEDRLLGTARSVWALLNLESRSAVDIYQTIPTYPDSVNENPLPDRQLVFSAPSRRVRVASSEPVITFSPLFCDIDYNGHFNSIKYLEHLLDAIPMEDYLAHSVHTVELAYNSECRYGDRLAIFADHPSPLEYALELRHADGPTACRCHVIFGS